MYLKIKNPSLSIYLEDIEENDLYKIKQIKNSIITTYIRDLVVSSSIYFDPDITDTSTIINDTDILEIVSENKLWNDYLEETDYKCSSKCNINSLSVCPYILILEFSKNKTIR